MIFDNDDICNCFRDIVWTLDIYIQTYECLGCILCIISCWFADHFHFQSGTSHWPKHFACNVLWRWYMCLLWRYGPVYTIKQTCTVDIHIDSFEQNYSISMANTIRINECPVTTNLLYVIFSNQFCTSYCNVLIYWFTLYPASVLFIHTVIYFSSNTGLSPVQFQGII